MSSVQGPDPNIKMIMHCDTLILGQPCPLDPRNGLRVVVPAVDWSTPGHVPLRMFTPLHYCDRHWEAKPVKIEDLLRDKQKAEFEAIARAKRPDGYKCDFDAAFIERILTTTPEYQGYMQTLKLAFAHA